MQRRRFLGAVGGAALLAGCASLSASRRSRDEDAVQRVSIPGVADVPSEFPVSLTAGVVEPRVTPDHPAGIEVRFRNDDLRQRTFLFGAAPPLSSPWTEPTGLFLYHPGSDVRKRGPACWRPEEEVPQGQGHGRFAVLRSKRLGPGEAITGTYEVWGDPRVRDACIPTGTFRVQSDEYGMERGDEEPGFAWGFNIEVRDV